VGGDVVSSYMLQVIHPLQVSHHRQRSAPEHLRCLYFSISWPGFRALAHFSLRP